MGGPLPPPSLTRAPPSAGLDDIEAKSAEGQARVGHRVLRRGLLPGVPGAHQFQRKSLRCTAPSKPTSNSLSLASFCLRRSSRLVPTCGVRVSRFLPACVRRKQAHHLSCPSRTGGGVFGRCRCAPRPDPFRWALAQPRRSPLLARRRAARDSLFGSRRSRAAFMLSRFELSHRAFLLPCSFGLLSQGF